MRKVSKSLLSDISKLASQLSSQRADGADPQCNWLPFVKVTTSVGSNGSDEAPLLTYSRPWVNDGVLHIGGKPTIGNDVSQWQAHRWPTSGV